MTALILGITIPFIAGVLAIWTGLPLWLVLRHPDRHPAETRSVPAYYARRAAAGATSAATTATTAAAAAPQVGQPRAYGNSDRRDIVTAA